MNIRKSIFAFAIMAIVFLAACGDDSSSSASGNAIPETDPNATLVSQVPVGNVYSDLTVRDANGNVVGVFDPNTGYITLSDGNVVTVDGNSVFESSSSSSSLVSSSSAKDSSSSSEKVSSSSVTEVQEKPNWKYLNPDISYGIFQDARDGQFYKTVTIGPQIWMAENLNYDYNEGTAKSFCYNDEPDSCAKYGRLYLWSAAMDSAGVFGDGGKGCGYDVMCSAKEPVRGICPEGWHLPSNTEWKILFATAGGVDLAGILLKSKSGWYNNGNGADEYGFSVLPAGIRRGDGDYYLAGEGAYFWSSSEYSGYNAYRWDFYCVYERVISGYSYKDDGYSVRCLKD